MNAHTLPPKPKIDIRQYLNRDRDPTAPSTPKPIIQKKPPPIPPRDEKYESSSHSPVQSHSSSQSSSSGTYSPASSSSTSFSPISLVTPQSSPPRNYAPKPMHTSVPLKTHHADNTAPPQIPSGFLTSKSRNVLAANDRYICVGTTGRTLLYSWRSSSLVWQLKHVGICAAFVDETGSVWLGTLMGRILVVDVSNGSILQTLERGHTKPVTFLATSKRGIISLSADDGRLNVWSPQNNGSPSKVNRVRAGICGKGSLAATGGFTSPYLWLCKGRQVEIYQPTEQMLPLQSIHLPGRGSNLGAITSATAYGDMACFGQNDGFISVFKGTQLLGFVNGGIYTITALSALSKTELWAGTRSGEILVFSLYITQMQDDGGSVQLSATLLRQWKAHPTSITQITMAESKSAVLSIDRGGQVLTWNWTPSDILPMLPSINQGFNVQVVTWNVGACDPLKVYPALLLTQRMREADMIVFGLQEVVELENTSQHALNIVRPVDVDQDKEHLKWQQFFETMLIPNGFTPVVSKSMVGLMICLFVKRERARYLSNVSTDIVKTGIGGAYGNKGGISVSFNLSNMNWNFTNCHLAAGHTAIIQRNRDASQIMTTERLQNDVVFFFGDTNYRINAAREQAESIIRTRDWLQLRKHDQLVSQIAKIPSFCLARFQEGPLTFPPTYKYDRGTNTYDTSDKKRIPSWCDRILFRGKSIMVSEYYAIQSIMNSDHKPVVGSYIVPLLV